MFNRLKCVQQTFPAIRSIQPKQLFIISDGPRESHPNDAEKVQACRDYVDASINWVCEVHRLYREKNLGCGYSIAEGLDWVFSRVDRAIILEDDILPDPSFFLFCEVLLEYYKDDERVYSITGRNHRGVWDNNGQPYFFTHKLSQLGWATWNRAWSKYEFSMCDWRQLKNRLSVFATLRSLNDFLIDYFFLNGLYQNPRLDAWDFQWFYTCIKHSGLCAMPAKNLTAHIGIGEEATHTKNWTEPFGVYSYDGEFPKYQHPKPDRNFQKRDYIQLSVSEKIKRINKMLKNEIKFLLGMNN